MLGDDRICRKEVAMRRLAAPAAFVCLLTVAALALPAVVRAAGLAGQDARCPRGPDMVASHTGMEASRDGQSVSIDFALRDGCENVEVSLLSYLLTAGPASGDRAEQALYDVRTATVSAGQINRLDVAVMPGCWSLTMLVVGRPPSTGDAARMRAWERHNTVHSKADGGPEACAPTGSSGSSLLGGDGLLGTLLQPPGSAAPPAPAPETATAPEPPETQPGPVAASQPETDLTAPLNSATPPAAEPDGDTAGPDGAESAAGEEPATQNQPETAPRAEGTRDADRLAAGREDGSADGGTLPLTGTPVGNLTLAGVGLVMAGAALLRLGRRYRARHLGLRLGGRRYHARHLAS
jgi:hypothetical protein